MVPTAHADVDKLLTTQPLVSATVLHSNLPTVEVAAALCGLISTFEFHVTAAALVPDVSLQIQTPDEGITSIDASILGGGGGAEREGGGGGGGGGSSPLLRLGLRASGDVSTTEISVKVSEAVLRSGSGSGSATTFTSTSTGANPPSTLAPPDDDVFVQPSAAKERAGSSGSGIDDDDDSTRISVCASGEFTLALGQSRRQGADEDDDRALGGPPTACPAATDQGSPSLVSVLMDAGAKRSVTTPIDYSGHVTIRSADYGEEEEEVGGRGGTRNADVDGVGGDDGVALLGGVRLCMHRRNPLLKGGACVP